MEKKVLEVIKKDGLKVEFKEVDKIIKEVESKSGKMKGLYGLGFYIGSIREILKIYKIEVSYNFIYNVISGEVNEVRKKVNKNDGSSKSSMIKELYEKGFSVREIGEEFVKKGIYINSNMIYGVIKKLKKKEKEEVK